MSTKPPSQIEAFPENSLEKRAYKSVSDIPAREANDRNRLGYHVWRWLTDKKGTLEEVIRESGARINITADEAARKIRESLTAQGIKLP
jgi:hypothetical protein